MKNLLLIQLYVLLFAVQTGAQTTTANPATYLDSLRIELKKEWPINRTINMVFHGHSVPSGYFVTPDVRTLSAYPQLVLEEVKKTYPYAVVNSIVTAIGGENSEQGAARFAETVLCHKPDVIFIDYALNDRSIGLDRAEKAWKTMIEQSLAKNIPVVLLTPTPDKSTDIMNDNSPLAHHAAQIRQLAVTYRLGLVDSYAAFREAVEKGTPLDSLMSQVNHPNENGHRIVASLIIPFFREY
jgi:lysophospholipase L1-like esterase